MLTLCKPRFDMYGVCMHDCGIVHVVWWGNTYRSSCQRLNTAAHVYLVVGSKPSLVHRLAGYFLTGAINIAEAASFT